MIGLTSSAIDNLLVIVLVGDILCFHMEGSLRLNLGSILSTCFSMIRTTPYFKGIVPESYYSGLARFGPTSIICHHTKG